MQWFICSLVAALLSAFPTGDAATLPGRRFGSVKISCPVILVDPSGAGNFTTVQAAIDAVPSNNPNWICIHVKAGVYKEQVLIPFGKNFVYLQGEGMQTTNIVWGAHDTIQTSSTFSVQSDNVIAQSISFINSYNFPYNPSVNKMNPAPAALLQGDKLAFYQCGFFGLQDTLWDCQGRHYFQGCTIQGAVDFIFGAGQSFYEKCTISVVGGGLDGPGFITAQGRSTPNEPNGFVFNDCTITGQGKVYLGRPWRPYARVVFFDTIMPDIIVPQGWAPMYSSDEENTVTFDEIKCSGSGAVTTGRVNWVNRQSISELQQLTSISFIDGSSWLISV